MRVLQPTFLALAVLVGTAQSAFAEPKPAVLEEEKALIQILPPEGYRLVPAYRDRAAWEKLIREREIDVSSYVKTAEAIAREKPAPFPLEEYYGFTRKGDRTQFETKNEARWNCLTALAEAECLENKGRFLPAIAAYIDALCDAPTWVNSAHDWNLKNVQGKTIAIDLVSSHVAWRLSEVLACFGDALPEATRTKGIHSVRKFVINPYLEMANTGNYNNWWAHSEANWNPVCHAGVLGAGLALPGLTPQERARIVASTKVMVHKFLKGFSKEGWTDEGVIYWNYGFGHFAMLCEEARRATQGKQDWLLEWEGSRQPALMAPQTRLAGDIFPVLADCPQDVHADPDLEAWLRVRFGLPINAMPSLKNRLDFPTTFVLNLDALPQKPVIKPQPLPRRTWMPEAQILVDRTPRLAFVAMGNNNGVPHNHNDCGTFMVTLDAVPVLADLGGEEYSRRTFSGSRYQSELLNSFGHPVPRPANTLQASNSKAAAKVLEATFSDASDKLVFDLLAAYPKAPGLKTCKRAFTWEPKGDSAKLTVRDDFAFDAPQTFESPLTTWGTCKQEGDLLTITFKGKSLRARVTASAPWHLEEAVVKGKAKEPSWQSLTPMRYAVKLNDPAQAGFIQFEITD